MKKQEFLLQLQRELNGRIGSREAAPVVSYYQEYIEIQMRKGCPEENVLEELGSPALIARSVAQASESGRTANAGSGTGAGKVQKLWRKCICICSEVLNCAGKWFEKLK